MRVRVGRPRPIVEFGDLVEHTPELAGIGACHGAIFSCLPLCGLAPCYGAAPRWQQGGLSARDIFPALLSHFDEAGWNVLGYHYAPGRHADYPPAHPTSTGWCGS